MGQLEDIQVFLRVVEAGGISRAAEQLHIAKSAVSRRLSELESRLQTTLIQRTTRQFYLTEAGERYYKNALKVVDSVKELDALLTERVEYLEGKLTVSLPLSFGLLHMKDVIDEFMQLHPRLSLNVMFSDSEINLIEEGVDVAFRIGNLSDSTLQARKIVVINMAICAAPDYIHEHGEPKSVDDLKKMDFLCYSPESSQPFYVTTPNKTIESFMVKGRLQSNNGDFLKEMALTGHGTVVLPTFICWQELQTGALIPILNDHKMESLNGYAIYPQNRYLSRNARVFIDFLVEYFKEIPYWDEP